MQCRVMSKGLPILVTLLLASEDPEVSSDPRATPFDVWLVVSQLALRFQSAHCWVRDPR
jgi:hypothetical protein